MCLRLFITYGICLNLLDVEVKGENKKLEYIDLTLSVLAVLVGRHVVDGVAR